MTRLGPGDLIRRFPHGNVKPLWDSLEYSQSSTGPTARMKFHVSGLQGDAPDLLPIAVNASGIPRVGDLFFGDQAPVVIRVSGQMMQRSTDQAMVTVDWGPIPDPALVPPEPPVVDADGLISISSTIQGGTTRYDAQGAPLTVGQDFVVIPLVDGEAGPQQIVAVDEWKEVGIQWAMHVVRFSALTSSSPGDIATQYVGHTNATAVFNDDPGMWLCTQLEGSSSDGGETWSTTYEFQRAAEAAKPVTPAGADIVIPGGVTKLGWNAVINLEGHYDIEGLNEPSLQLVTGQGIRAVRLYPQVEFRGLTNLASFFGSAS